MRISHEAIYQALFIQGRGALRRELTACLRSGRTLRVPKAKPSQAREVRGLDCPSARRRVECAGRDGRMGSAGAEQKDATSRQEEQQRKDTMTSDSVA